MDTNRAKVVQLIVDAIHELNSTGIISLRVPSVDVSEDSNLIGQDGLLDSLGLVNLILLVEERVANEFGVSITLADEKAMSQRNSPFRSVQSLAEYISLLLDEKQNG